MFPGGGVPAVTKLTATLTVAVSHALAGSHTVYVKVSVPAKPPSGVYVTVPFALMTTVPLAGWTTEFRVRRSESGSLSLPSTLIVTEPTVVTESSNAFGGSFGST